MAGYSKTPLARKLGIRPGTRVVAIGAPEDYCQLLAPLPEGARVEGEAAAASDFVHLFVRDRAALAAQLPPLRDALPKQGTLWVSWPKKSSGVATDLDGNLVRSLGLAAGLVDVKVCAVDDLWSGLKFVWRLADR